MSIPTDNEMNKFKETLKQDGIDVVKRKLSQQIYGSKSEWRYKEAEDYVKGHRVALELMIKQESLKQQIQANKIALCALGISILALVIAVIAIFK